jgi:hypothetical protein
MLNPKDILAKQQSAELSSVLRSGKSGVKLLDDSDLNIGNSAILEPSILALGGQTWTSKPPTNSDLKRLLNLTASSRMGQSVTVVMTAARVAAPEGFVGPITGIIEFGNGAVSTKIEFDIPVGPFVGVANVVSDASSIQDSGTVIQVPTSVLRAYARYDNALLTPIKSGGGPVFGQTAPYAVPAGSGPFAPNSTNNNNVPGIKVAPVSVKAFAAYFGRHYSKLYKTQYLYIGNDAAPVLFQHVAGVPVNYAIPPFAKSVRIVRVPQTAVLTVTLTDQLAWPYDCPTIPPPSFADQYTIPSGVMANPIPIDGNTNSIAIQSAGALDTISAIKLVYEVGF